MSTYQKHVFFIWCNLRLHWKKKPKNLKTHQSSKWCLVKNVKISLHVVAELLLTVLINSSSPNRQGAWEYVSRVCFKVQSLKCSWMQQNYNCFGNPIKKYYTWTLKLKNPTCFFSSSILHYSIFKALRLVKKRLISVLLQRTKTVTCVGLLDVESNVVSPWCSLVQLHIMSITKCVGGTVMSPNEGTEKCIH